MTHALHYGTSVFEGIRCYATSSGPAIFRGKDHIRRFYDSAKIYRMSDLGFAQQQIIDALPELVRVNGLQSCYLRPITFRGYGDVGVLSTNNPMELYIVCWEWGQYLGADALEKGVDVCVSSWTRLAPNTLPAMAKVAANYMNSQLIKMEAVTNGYSEGIALDVSGYVSEGSGENVFLVRDGKIHTPPLGTSVLPGITRATVVELCHDVGFELIEQVIPREWLLHRRRTLFLGHGSGDHTHSLGGPHSDRLRQTGSDDRAAAAGIHGGHHVPKGRPARLADLCENTELRHSLS